MKKLLLILALMCMIIFPVFSQTGDYTTNEYFYLPEYGAYGLDEYNEYNTYMQVADTQIEANKTALANKQPLDAQLTDIAGLTPTDSYFIVGDGTNFITETGATARTSLGIDLSLYYLKTEIDTESEVEVIWGVGLAHSGANTDITSIYNTSLKFGRDADNLIDFTTDNKIVFRTGAANRMEITSTGELDMNAHSVGFTLGTATGDGATLINWQAGLKFKFTFGSQNETITFTNPSNPCAVQMIIVQDATGSRTITWSGMTIKWADGTAITLSTAANAEDIVSMFWDGTSYYAMGNTGFATP